MSDLVENPKDRFSRVMAQIITMFRLFFFQTLSKGNFEPPDILNNTKLHQKSSKLYYIGLTVVGGVILSVIWNRQALMEKAWTLWPK